MSSYPCIVLGGDELLYQDEQELQDQTLLGYATFDELKFDGLSPSTQNCQEDQITKLGEIVQNGNQDGEHKKDKLSEELHLASLELLRRFGNGFRRLKSGRIVEPTYDAPPYTAVESRGFSTEEIMGIAGAKFIQSSLLPDQLMFPLCSTYPFNLSLAGLSHEDAKMVELSEFLLLASAEKVSCESSTVRRDYSKHCEECSSDIGNPVERVAYYFSEALRERIEIKSGRITSKWLEEEPVS
ncbi:PROTEIN GAI1 putative-RELATED [Salix purpurea]|uniref:PROTEIN GAI1 putative-RELATED n=1 Tax=Salix purpurea TaxID=77065 RepID=A0A9Q0VA46_SALPP|nr:PROTEIN GAI1 putative-RELATED [Salix purpurea]